MSADVGQNSSGELVAGAVDAGIEDALRRLAVVSLVEESAQSEIVRRLRVEELVTEAKFPPRAFEVAQRAEVVAMAGRWSEKKAALVGRLAGGLGTVAIYGETRRGKTVLAVTLGLEFVRSRLRSVRYIRLLQLMLRFEAANRLENQSREAVLEQFADVPFLILDECGKGFGSEAEARLFFELIDERHNRKRDTVLVSNASEDQLKAWLGAALVARINECGGFVECDWGQMSCSAMPGQ